MITVELLAITPNAAEVIERAGRTSYQSFSKMTKEPIYSIDFKGVIKQLYAENYSLSPMLKVGDNVEIENIGRGKIISKWRNSSEKFVEMIVKNGHLSVLEHASATFLVKGGSRAFTHQLVRHRLAAFTQQSQRYVDEGNFNFVLPKSIEENAEAKALFISTINTLKDVYGKLRQMNIRKEDARFLLPNAIESEIVVSSNFREWRHILKIRGEKAAQWEIRDFAVSVLKIFKEQVPEIFYDMDIDKEKNVILFS